MRTTEPSETGTSGRLEVVDALRGLAAAAVAWFHFTQGEGNALVGEGLLKASGTYAWAGVDVFFVLSGFVVPLSMLRSGYSVSAAHRFVGRRVVRLDPPYLVAVAVCVALLYASALTPGFRGSWPDVTVGRVLAHLAYLNSILGFEWFNLVFWSLAIEFQYYLAIALLFPAVAHRSALLWGGCLLGLVAISRAAAGAVDQHAFILPHLGAFAAGMTVFQCQRGSAGVGVGLGLIGLTAAVIWSHNPPSAYAVAGTAVVLLFTASRRVPRQLLWLGALSYSFYLLHAPIGGRVINLANRFLSPGPLTTGGALVVAALASLAAAYALHVFVERPAQRWSRRIQLGDRAEDGARPTGVVDPAKQQAA